MQKSIPSKENVKGITNGIEETTNISLGFLYSLSLISLLNLGGFYFQGWELSQALVTVGNGIAITYGSVLAIGTLAGSYSLNDRKLTDLTDKQSYSVYLTIGFVALLTIAPTLRNLIISNRALQVGAFVMMLLGYGYVAKFDRGSS